MSVSLKLYALFLVVCLVLWIVGLVVYALVTPQREMKLIAQGNRAAALSLGGTGLGLAVVLAACAAQTSDLNELLRLGGLALVAQIAAFVVIALVLPGFRAGIAEDKVSYGIVLGAFSLAVGIINAGAIIG